MKKLTRKDALRCIALRLMYVANAKTRDDLKIISCSGRNDLGFLCSLGLITCAEKIVRECDLSRAVQSRLADMMPMRLVGGVA